MLNPRLATLSDYPFDRLRALLQGVAPNTGLPPLVLSVGEPRHPPPLFLSEVLAYHKDLWGRYPPIEGTADFRSNAIAWLQRRFCLPAGMLDPERHILPVAGTREALFLIASVLVPERKSGHQPAVLMPNPFYQVYFGAAAMSGAEPVFLPATAETAFLPDLSVVSDVTWQRTAILYLCSPANPQGAVANSAYLQRAVATARAYDFVLVVDECYADIYDTSPPAGALSACAILGGEVDNVLVFHSLSKRSSVPGLRSGFVSGDETVIAAFRRLRGFAGATVPLPILAASAALWADDEHAEANRAIYRSKFDAAERFLRGRFVFERPQGGFFLWLRVEDGERAARALWAEGALRVLPGAYLSKPCAAGGTPGDGYIRIALVDDLPTTEEALSRIRNIL